MAHRSTFLMTNADGRIIPFQTSTPRDWLLPFPHAGLVSDPFGLKVSGFRGEPAHYSCVATFMEFYYESMVRFEWDESKARSNARKHGVRFEDAMLVFADPYALVERTPLADPRPRRGHRSAPRCHSIQDEQEHEIIRIISARKAVRKERKRYDENRKKESLG